MFELLTYPPVLRGFIVLMVSGLTFPITGVYLLRMNLLPLRFMLMHGAILGGAIALALHIEPFLTTIIVNLILVFFMTRASRKLNSDIGHLSIFMMVASIGIAFVLISVFNVQAKDTLEILWGSIFTISKIQFVGVVVIALFLALFQLFKHRQLMAVFYDSDIANTVGVNEKNIYYSIILITAFTVGVAIKIIGALLIDTIIILPALIAILHTKSFKSTIRWAVIWGGIFSFCGFFVAYQLKIPTSSAIALIAVVIFVFLYLAKQFRK